MPASIISNMAQIHSFSTHKWGPEIHWEELCIYCLGLGRFLRKTFEFVMPCLLMEILTEKVADERSLCLSVAWIRVQKVQFFSSSDLVYLYAGKMIFLAVSQLLRGVSFNEQIQ